MTPSGLLFFDELKVALSEGCVDGASKLNVAVGHVWTAPWQELSDVAAGLVGCGHVSGLLMRRGWPLALMLCADRVPIVHMHLEMR
jgi:hypothetical protein